MRNAGLEETQAGIKIAERHINNLQYADDTTLMAESEEELKSLLISFEYPGSAGAGPHQVAPEQGPQEAILKELSRHEPRNQQAIRMELSSDESCCSTGNNQARDQAGITQLSWQLSSR